MKIKKTNVVNDDIRNTN